MLLSTLHPVNVPPLQVRIHSHIHGRINSALQIPVAGLLQAVFQAFDAFYEVFHAGGKRDADIARCAEC